MTTEHSVPEELLSALRKHRRVLIAAHTNPDPDAMGSCLALAWALRSTGVDALVFNEDGLGAIINSSRGIIAAYKQEKYASFGAEAFGDASRAAVEDMIADISGALNG